MQMPESYRIEGDKLTIIVGEAEYEFVEKKDFIRSDSEKILMKHHAITVLAQNANIYVSMPVLLTSHDSNCFVIAREARKDDGSKYSAVGESNPNNLWSEYLEQYPAETADNRAYDRAVLGVIGVVDKGPGSLKSYGIEYRQVDLVDNAPDPAGLAQAVKDPRVKAVLIQRSRGYATRNSLSVEEIGSLAQVVKDNNPHAAVLVDNCYGEFVETIEPTQVGADLVVGSLIKNPGGGLAPTGGYIAGRRDLVEGAAMRLTTPGIGKECGSTFGANRSLYQGLFLAPHTTAQAVKTAVFAARMMELLGYRVDPASDAVRHDIIQMLHFGAPEPLKKFCKGIQFGAPVDSYVTPEPWDMPGYDCQVIMAAGAFIQGASIELSCDAPMREPYTAYLQGGLTYESGKAGVMLAVEELLRTQV